MADLSQYSDSQLEAIAALADYSEKDLEEIASQNNPQQPGFIERTGKAWVGRGREMGDSVAANIAGKQSFPETAYQLGGQSLLATGDLLGNAAVSAYRTLPDQARGLLESAGGGVVEAAGSLPSYGGGTLGENIPREVSFLMNSYEQNVPERAKRNLESSLGYLGAFPPEKVLGLLAAPARATSSGFKQVGKAIASAIPKPEKITSAMLRKESGKFYNLSRKAGGVFSVNKVSTIIDEIKGSVRKTGETLPRRARAKLIKLKDKEGVIREAQGLFEALRGETLDLQGFEEIDKALGSLANKSVDKFGNVDEAGQKILEMQSILRDGVDSVAAKDLIGGREGLDAYKKAKDLWRKSSKIRDIQNLAARAMATQIPVNSLRGGLKRFLADPKKTRGFSAEEIASLEKIAETGAMEELTGFLTGRLTSRIAAGSGDFLTGGALAMAGDPVRRVLSNRMLGKLDDSIGLIARGAPAPKLGAIESLAQGARKSSSVFNRTGDVINSVYGGRGSTLGALGILQGKE